MNTSTGSGPSRAMRARSFASNGFAADSSALGIGRCRNAPAGPADQEDAGENHGQRIQYAGGKGADGEDVARVGLAKQLADRAREAVSGKKGTGDNARPTQCQLAVRQPPQDGEQDDALQRSLVELARMARKRSCAEAWKYHRPGHVAHSAPELAVNEVRKTAEEQPHRRGCRTEVHHAPDICPDAPGEQDDGDDRAKQGAVKGHATVPDGNHLERI